MVSPAFHGDILLGFACLRAHRTEIGSATPTLAFRRRENSNLALAYSDHPTDCGNRGGTVFQIEMNGAQSTVSAICRISTEGNMSSFLAVVMLTT